MTVKITVKEGFIEIDDERGKCYIKDVAAINVLLLGSTWGVRVYPVSTHERFDFYLDDKKEAELVADEIYNACRILNQKRHGYRVEESE
jgi:hypothetical protein